VLYRAVRVGIDGRPFTMYKLRTMRPHGVGPVITSCDDPRVFFLGRWLRRLKIDELPQLVNVLKGDMSVVGPRPEDPEIVQRYYGPAQLETLTVLPGLASPGSIYGSTHGEPLLLGVDSERLYVEQVLPLKLALELVYVRRASLSYDLLIVARTFAVLFGLIVGRRDFGRPPEIRQVMELAASEAIGPSVKAAGVSGLAINAVRVSGDGAVVED
jgi:lipopolysaccharide/colanic/teichoic acid biosynthesis glycosyltransferase